MPKISEARRQARRAEIMAAALRCFARNGYRGTSMADIIAESQLSAGAIYSYFASKKELIRSVAGSVLEGREHELDSAGEDHVLEPAEIAITLIRGLRAHAPISALLQVWSEASVDSELRVVLNDVIGRVRTTICQQLEIWAHTQQTIDDPAAWAQHVTPTLLALVPGYVMQTTLTDNFDDDDFLRALPELLRGSA
ncbi:TetR/AcrR family transcriptional regulator [Paramicrobacterium chengjingii]|uniref:TetR/AcrR family transcriptional regulator n=1 Tax=Paramicrobacterium chengjingii TaxID=2769067 RepID=A0ABX6YIF9_9MICO|nr:TetR/AcrR family transcriptional regulator [Microbacterium chengjingii]QPZ38606.1 TetR/AcrR family transcriptional regulator [Microbacterium chengjingii]